MDHIKPVLEEYKEKNKSTELKYNKKSGIKGKNNIKKYQANIIDLQDRNIPEMQD